MSGRQSAAGILLTGGESRRMGFDKTVVSVGGLPCAQRAALLMSASLAPVVEVGPGRTSLPTVREEPAGAGPLAALATGAAWLRTHGGEGRAVVVVAGDLPFVTADVLTMLRDWPGGATIVPVVEGRPQPLLARWSPGALEEAAGWLSRGERALRPLLRRADVELADETRWPRGVLARAFADIDTPEDLERLGLGG